MTKPSEYKPVHPQLADAKTSWARCCPKCDGRFIIRRGLKKHPIFGLMCPKCSGL